MLNKEAGFGEVEEIQPYGWHAGEDTNTVTDPRTDLQWSETCKNMAKETPEGAESIPNGEM